MKPILAGLLIALGIGCASQPKVTLRFHEQVSEALPESRVRVVDVPHSDQRVTVDPFAQLTEKDVLEAQLRPTPGGNAVWLRFDLHGANKLNELTTRMRGEYLVVLMNDRPVAAVLVDRRIVTGEFLLEGDMTDDEARELVDGLNHFSGRRRDYGDTRFKP